MLCNKKKIKIQGAYSRINTLLIEKMKSNINRSPVANDVLKMDEIHFQICKK